jgi:L-ascorbate metabolism protein UlaG (beta-lactamase superfamily)
LLQKSRNWAREQNCIGFASDRAGRIVIDRTFPAHSPSNDKIVSGAPDSSMTLKPAERIGNRYQNPVPTSVGSASMMFKVFKLYVQNRAERTPKRQLGPFHTDARIYQQPPASGLRVTWFGHSSTLLEIDGIRILIDPVWDQRAAPVEWAGPKRFFAPTLPLDQLPPIDAILLSHDHYDHYGANTIKRLAGMKSMAQIPWITTLGIGKRLIRRGVNAAFIRELDWTERTNVGPIEFTALPARHFSGRGVFDRWKTLWASFALAGPTHRVYYGADSGEWEGFADVGREYGPFDLTMLEIGAFDPLWADIHMGPDGAARTFHALGGKGLLMPIHWGLFDLALHAWRQPIERIFSLDKLRLFSPVPGVPTDVVPDIEVRSEWWR